VYKCHITYVCTSVLALSRGKDLGKRERERETCFIRSFIVLIFIFMFMLMFVVCFPLKPELTIHNITSDKQQVKKVSQVPERQEGGGCVPR